jgi:uncharacterized membrane protein YbhN (UPF0104 family)
VDLPFLAAARMYLASYAADNLFMSQAGLGVRFAVTVRAGAPWEAAAALQALEKSIEGAGLALLALLVIAGAPAAGWPAWIDRPVRVGLVIAALGGTLVAALVLLARARRDPSAARSRWRRFVDSAAALRRPALGIEVISWSVSAWALELVLAHLALSAASLPSAPAVAALVVLAANLAAVVPGLPANLGAFEAAVTVALEAAGATHGAALGGAILYHLAHTLPVTVLGVADLRRLDWRRREVQ